MAPNISLPVVPEAQCPRFATIDRRSASTRSSLGRNRLVQWHPWKQPRQKKPWSRSSTSPRVRSSPTSPSPRWPRSPPAQRSAASRSSSCGFWRSTPGAAGWWLGLNLVLPTSTRRRPSQFRDGAGAPVPSPQRREFLLAVDGVAHEVAVLGELVVEAARAIVGVARVPVEPAPALGFRLPHEPIDQLLPDAAGALLRIDEQIAEIARRRHAERVLVDQVVGDADDASAFFLRDDRVHWHGWIHDAAPGIGIQRLIGLALVEHAVAVEELAPALLVARFGRSHFHQRMAIKHL